MKKKSLQKKLSFEVKNLSLLNADQTNELAGGQLVYASRYPECKPTIGSACATNCYPLQCQA